MQDIGCVVEVVGSVEGHVGRAEQHHEDGICRYKQARPTLVLSGDPRDA